MVPLHGTRFHPLIVPAVLALGSRQRLGDSPTTTHPRSHHSIKSETRQGRRPALVADDSQPTRERTA
jgi:hypothetical protein